VTLSEWLAERGVKTAFIEKGSPQQNAFVERFNGTMHDEVLNGEEFDSLLEARVVIGNWLVEYNTLRPHRGLGMPTRIAGMRPAESTTWWLAGRRGLRFRVAMLLGLGTPTPQHPRHQHQMKTISILVPPREERRNAANSR